MFRERKFRFNLWTLMPVFTVGVAVGIEVLLLMGHRNAHLWRYPLAMVGTLAASGLFCGIIWTLFPVHAGTEGLRGTDGVGRFHDVRWNEMTKVSSLFGFYWVRHGKLGKSLCFPKFLEEKRGFRDYVLQHAPEDNPLREYLRDA